MMNRDRYSETESSDRDGRCAISMCSFLSAAHYLTAWRCRPRRVPRAGGAPHGVRREARLRPETHDGGSGHRALLRVELDDQLLGDVHDDLLACRQLVDEDPHGVRTGVHPRRNLTLCLLYTSPSPRDG